MLIDWCRSITYFLLFFRVAIAGSKLYSGQRMFTDTEIISFVDPAKHGFHVILDATFVHTHLQPVNLPTVYASAIGLKSHPPRAPRAQRRIVNETGSDDGSSRMTKILYPENGNPDHGLIDGRTIKLLGLQERSWYFVCVEFESNVNRHEIATGTSCRLARTLDKFGKTVESTVSEIELVEITDESIRVRVNVDADFPLRLHVYLAPDSDHSSIARSTPAQMYIARRSQMIDVIFDSLQPSTTYGRLCILEEPLAEAYTAMGRSARATSEHCYFEDLRTKPRDNDYLRRMYEKGVLFIGDQAGASAALGEQEMAKLVSAASQPAVHWCIAGCIFMLFICL